MDEKEIQRDFLRRETESIGGPSRIRDLNGDNGAVYSSPGGAISATFEPDQPPTPPIIIAPPVIPNDDRRETRHDLFLQTHPEGIYTTPIKPVKYYPPKPITTTGKPEQIEGKRNIIDIVFDWINGILNKVL